MTDTSDFLINKFAITTCVNLILLVLILPNTRLQKWFERFCRRSDGSWLGLLIMMYGFVCAVTNLSFYWLFDFKSYDLVGTIKAYVSLSIFVSVIPIMIGREIWKGKKILTTP